jgi:hypothetical protein
LAFTTISIAGGAANNRDCDTDFLKLSPPLMAFQTAGNSDASRESAIAATQTPMLSPFRAFVQSMVIPGWGQRYVGKGTSFGTVNFVTEVVLLGAVAGFDAYGDWKRDAYKTFAATHAGVSNQGKDHQYYVDIGNYHNIDQYNGQQRRDRDFAELYLSESDWWEWDNTDNRLLFKRLRIQSDNALNNRYYVLGAVFLNHLVSAIHASRQAAKLNRSLNSTTYRLPAFELSPTYCDGAVGLRLTGRF